MVANSAYFFTLISLLFFVSEVFLLDNDVARTPPLGWMSWGYLECAVDCKNATHKCLNEELIISVADHMIEDGYYEAGYRYIVIDDCWMEKKRDKNGRLVPDKKRFPRGMKYLADYIHSKDLKFGIYTSAGPVTCKLYPASLNYEEVDAKTFAEWDVDYLKVDGCFVDEPTLNYAYIKLGQALIDTGRPIVYSCSWPYYIKFIHNHQPDFLDVAKHCNLWRDYHDIFPFWASVVQVIRYYEEQYDLLEQYHGPGHWFDPDMLLVGRGILTEGQSRVQMTVYCLLSAPLIFSFDMGQVTESESNILRNPYLLAINQDRMGKAAKPFKKDPTMTVWVKTHHPIKGGLAPTYTFAVINYLHKMDLNFSFVPTLYEIVSVSDEYTVFDVFQEKYLYNTTLNSTININVPPSGVILTLWDISDKLLARLLRHAREENQLVIILFTPQTRAVWIVADFKNWSLPTPLGSWRDNMYVLGPGRFRL